MRERARMCRKENNRNNKINIELSRPPKEEEKSKVFVTSEKQLKKVKEN